MIRVVDEADTVRVAAVTYRWEWDRETDRVDLYDASGHIIARQLLQPYVRVEPAPLHGSGRCTGVRVLGHRLEVSYDDVNDGGHVTIALRFLDDYFMLEHVTYESVREEDVVALYYAYDDRERAAGPNGTADYYIVPGASQAPEQYIFPAANFANGRVSLGCFGLSTGTFNQQPFLPHYMVAVCSAVRAGAMETFQAGWSGAACLGLAAIPDGNVMLDIADHRFSPYLNYRSDLWHVKHGPGTLRFDVPWIVAVAETWYAAMRRYIQILVDEGYGRRKARESVPVSAYWPEYDIWGDQVKRECIGAALTQDHLETIYRDFRASNMKARLFVIDDMWEEAPGALEHSRDRFPTFETFLDRVRADGHEIGLWTAFARCQDYRRYGLDDSAVLRTPQGNPYRHRAGWYIFDPTHPDVERHLRERAGSLVRRYRPKLIKLDFGYEIPPPDVAAPHDLAWAGERLFQKFLDVIVPAVRQADPEVTIQYYALTPLLAAYYDHYSFDDMWLARENYHDAFNKRAVLSTLCGEFGVVPYGSTGYDWASAQDIWFDTPVVGTLGSLAPFVGDARGDRATRYVIAKFNGLTRLSRQNPYFTVEFLDADLNHPGLGPRVSSWVRLEEAHAVVVALRPRRGCAGIVGDRYGTLLTTDCPIVAASLDDQALAETSRIGLVSCGTGTVRLSRRARAVEVVASLIDGETWTMPVTMQDGSVIVSVTDRSPDGIPIEFMELRLS